MLKGQVYYNYLKRGLARAVSEESLKKKLDYLVMSTSRASGAGASLVLLDSSGNNLVHSSSWQLPKYYLQKGLLDPRQSLDEISSGRSVVINDISTYRQVQYRELAEKARITGIAAVPVKIEGKFIGSLRVYFKDDRQFSNQDTSFFKSMSELVSVAIKQAAAPHGSEGFPPLAQDTILQRARTATFAHQSEAEFAGLLDFYHIEWVYEPRAFVLHKEGRRVTEMFSPDFYLPALDLFVELTTIKQNLITRKNRKIKTLKKLYPEVKITLLNKNDYANLLAKYGVGPLGQTRAHGIAKILFTQEQISQKMDELAARISNDYSSRRPVLLGVQRGFICFMADLIRKISIPLDIDFMAISRYSGKDGEKVRITKDPDLVLSGRHILLIEDIVDTGMTLGLILASLKSTGPASLEVCTLLDRKSRRIADVKLRYSGFEIEDEFLVGYGLDYKEEYRNLPFIGIPEITGLGKSLDK